MLHEKYEDLDFIADIFITYQFPMAFITSITLSILFYLDIATIMKYSDADRKILYNTIDIIDNYILLYPIVHNKIDMFASLLYDGCENITLSYNIYSDFDDIIILYNIRHNMSKFKTILKNFILYKTSLRREWIHSCILV